MVLRLRSEGGATIAPLAKAVPYTPVRVGCTVRTTC